MPKKYKKLKLDTVLLKKNKVGLVILFGSMITKTAHPESDVDIGIVFENEKLRKKNPVNVYGDLYQVFSATFEIPNPDIVYLKETPLSLQFRAINEGEVIYQSSAKFSSDYREEVMIKYFDFQFMENYSNKIFLGQKL